MAIEHHTTSALIPFVPRQVGSETIQTVNARDLHEFLGPKARFNDWIARRIAAYGFQEGLDFAVLKNEYQQNQVVIEGTESTIEYHVSLDMAKELSMVERTKKGKEARQYFLACEKALEDKRIPLPPALPLYRDRIEDLTLCADFLHKLGIFDDRDRLMLGDLARTGAQQRYALSTSASPALPMPQGFFLADRVADLGYRLSRKEGESLLAGGLSKAVAAEYRKSHNGDNPSQSQRFVDGAVRPVNWYRQDEAAWIDAMVQSACDQRGFVITTGDTQP